MIFRLVSTLAVGVVAGLLVGSANLAATPIYANNPPPGDWFTNPGPTNQGQAVGASGWYYNNVRNGGVVGINTSYPRAGNASVYLSGFGSPSKADFEFLAAAVNLGGNWYAGGSLGSFRDLAEVSYEWYRDGSSTAASHLHPVVRVLLDRDGDLSTLTDRGGLVFEGVYNGWGAVPVNTWVSTVVSSSARLWNFGLGLPTAYDVNGSGYGYDETLSQWQAFLPNALILGFNVGIGSGWGPFTGAADNVSWRLGEQTSRFNFEVVPEPGSLALAGVGLGTLLAWRRLRRNASK